jgi:hypothetical protein
MAMDLAELLRSRNAAQDAVRKGPPGMRIWQNNRRHKHDYDFSEVEKQCGTIRVVDEFRGFVPEPISVAAMLRGSIAMTMQSILLLDSQMVSYLRRYLADPGDRNGKPEQIAPFLRWFAATDLQLHQGYTLQEAIAHGDDPKRDCIDITKACLRLNSMDRARFAATGEIALDPEAVEGLVREYGSADFDAIAEIVFASVPHTGVERIAYGPYAALLKIATIAKVTPYRDFEGRIDQLLKFFEVELGAILSIELIAATMYFTNQIGSFLPMDRKGPVAEKLQRLRAAAWDLYLLRMPAAFIAESDESLVRLPFIVSNDGALLKIAQFIDFAGVVSLPGEAPLPGIFIDPLAIAKAVPPGFEAAQEAIVGTMRRRTGDEARLSGGELRTLISNLEAEARRLWE